MSRYHRRGSNSLYRLTSLAVSLFCMLNDQVVADTTGDETEKALDSNDTITIGAAIAMIILIFLFAVFIFIRRRRNTRVAPMSKDWKIFANSHNPQRKRYTPLHRSNNSFSTKIPSGVTVTYPNRSHPRNAKNLFRSKPYVDGSPYFSDPYSESCPLRKLPNHSDVHPSLGDLPKLQTDSDTWEKYLIMMNDPEKLNEAVGYMGRTGHSPLH